MVEKKYLFAGVYRPVPKTQYKILVCKELVAQFRSHGVVSFVNLKRKLKWLFFLDSIFLYFLEWYEKHYTDTK